MLINLSIDASPGEVASLIQDLVLKFGLFRICVDKYYSKADEKLYWGSEAEEHYDHDKRIEIKKLLIEDINLLKGTSIVGGCYS